MTRAAAVATDYLASDATGYVTGAGFVIDGGPLPERWRNPADRSARRQPRAAV